MNEQDLVFRIRKRAEIRRQIQSRKSVQDGKTDRIADILEEAAAEIERLRELVDEGLRRRLAKMNLFSEEDIADAITWARPGEKPKGASLCLHPGGKSLSDIVLEDRSIPSVSIEDKNIQSMRSLKKEMLAVARGEHKSPADAGNTSFESIEAVRAWAERNADDLAAHGRDIAKTGIAGAEFDPMNPDSLNSFLEFLANDVERHPERLKSIDAGLVDRIRKLIGNINVDLDAPLREPMPDVLTKFAKFSPDFMDEGRVDHEQAARELQVGSTNRWEGMTCPACGTAKLVHGTRDASYSYKGQSTTLPALTGNYCPACPAMFLNLAPAPTAPMTL